MNPYTPFVRGFEKAFTSAGFYKLALDIAAIIDNPLFAYPADADGWALRGVVKIREPLFHELSSILSHLGMNLLSLEPQFHQARLMIETKPEHKAAADHVIKHVRSKSRPFTDTETHRKVEALLAVAEMFPSCFGYADISGELLIAKLNELLLSESMLPIRPDYSTWEPGPATKFLAPARPIHIVIVDDDLEKMATTAHALAGWPNTRTSLYHHNRNRAWDGKPVKLVKLEIVAGEIIDLDPDVIIMDQGIDSDIQGNELIFVVCGTDRDWMTFVANTGGSSEKLQSVGAYPNCDGGKELQHVIDAVKASAQVARV